jgi:hypothetical protein
VLGSEKVSLTRIIQAAWEFHYPYCTDKGKRLINDLRSQVAEVFEVE